MAYTPKTWQTGEVIKATDLNHLEQGVASAVASGGGDVDMNEYVTENNPKVSGILSVGYPSGAGSSFYSGSIKVGGTSKFKDYSGEYGDFVINGSAAIGKNLIVSAPNQTVIGNYNVEKGRVNFEPSGDDDGYFIVGAGLNYESGEVRNNAFRVTTNNIYGGNYNSTGADYAELFEWADGNPNSEDRAGRFVTLSGNKIRLSDPADDFILGIISGSPSVVGDVHDDQWQGMYLQDIFGRPLWEDVEVPDQLGPDGKVIIPAHMEHRQKLNPDYDRSQPYIPRSKRQEWDAVGMLGKLVAVDDGTCQPNGWAAVGGGGIATASEARTRYRVMSRLDDTHVRILIL